MILHDLKKFFVIWTLIITTVSCSSEKSVLFCEGIDAKGAGVHCGKKFHTGEVTAIVKQEEPFEDKKMEIVVSQIAGEEKIKVQTMKIELDPSKKQKSFNVPMYNPGTFQVDAMIKGKVISKGTITLVE